MLNLPEDPEFQSKKPKLTIAQAIRLSEMALPILNARPGEMERRWREKCHVPFRLLDEDDNGIS